MKNIDEKILMAEEEIKQLQNKKPSTKCCALPRARHQNHDRRRNHRLHPTTIQKKPIHAELLPRHRFRPDTNRKLHPRNRAGKENAAAVEQPLLLHYLPQTCLKYFSDDLEI